VRITRTTASTGCGSLRSWALSLQSYGRISGKDLPAGGEGAGLRDDEGSHLGIFEHVLVVPRSFRPIYARDGWTISGVRRAGHRPAEGATRGHWFLDQLSVLDFDDPEVPLIAQPAMPRVGSSSLASRRKPLGESGSYFLDFCVW
jgi:hypothetical protein